MTSVNVCSTQRQLFFFTSGKAIEVNGWVEEEGVSRETDVKYQ